MRNPEPRPAPSRARRGPSASAASPAQPQPPSEERTANRLSLRSSPFFYPESGPGGVKAAKRPKGLALTPPGPDSTLLKGNFLHHPVRYTPTRKVMFQLNQYIPSHCICLLRLRAAREGASDSSCPSRRFRRLGSRPGTRCMTQPANATVRLSGSWPPCCTRTPCSLQRLYKARPPGVGHQDSSYMYMQPERFQLAGAEGEAVGVPECEGDGLVAPGVGVVDDLEREASRHRAPILARHGLLSFRESQWSGRWGSCITATTTSNRTRME